MAFEIIMADSLLESRGRFILLLLARILFGLFSKFVFAIFNNKGVSDLGLSQKSRHSFWEVNT